MPPTMDTTAPTIGANDVVKRFGTKTTALDCDSISTGPGSINGLLGLNGAPVMARETIRLAGRQSAASDGFPALQIPDGRAQCPLPCP